ncbi:MAG: hypothetical protein AAGD32_09500 [Planctomycetota bacterium]
MKILVLLCVLVAIAVPMSVVGDSTNDAAVPMLRVGVYDTRAIAVAYAGSDFNDERLHLKMQEHAQAKADGDQAKVGELESWGKTQQRRLHYQGFAAVPVDDLLEPVAGQLPNVAAEAGVDVIVPFVTWTGKGVEIVDVTDELVALFEPNEQTSKFVASIRETDPVPIEDLEGAHDH